MQHSFCFDRYGTCEDDNCYCERDDLAVSDVDFKALAAQVRVENQKQAQFIEWLTGKPVRFPFLQVIED